MARFLLDASALYPLMRKPEEYIDILEDSCILDLTLYEVGNAALVAWRRGLLDDYDRFLSLLSELASLLTVLKLSAEDLKDVGVTARETGLTFYDAAYVYAARKHGLILVTEDKEILGKAPDVARSLKSIAQS